MREQLAFCTHPDLRDELKAALKRRNQAEIVMYDIMLEGAALESARAAYREAADEVHRYGRCRDCGRTRLRSET